MQMSNGVKKVMVFGVFDLLHAGHLDLFKQAKQHGDELVVVVARNINVFRNKGHYPKNDEKIRLTKIMESRTVNIARLGNLEDPFQVIHEEKPDVICLGYDQHSHDKNLIKEFPNIEIVRLKAFQPEIYKSSKLLPID